MRRRAGRRAQMSLEISKDAAVSARRDYPLRGLLIAQFFGAFNDNAWKLLVAFLGIRAVAAEPASQGPELEALSQTRTTLAFVAFTLPLVLFSLPAGVLADRLSKRSIILAMKAIEVVLMVGGTLALWLDPARGVVALTILALMGAQSALFSCVWVGTVRLVHWPGRQTHRRR